MEVKCVYSIKYLHHIRSKNPPLTVENKTINQIKFPVIQILYVIYLFISN